MAHPNHEQIEEILREFASGELQITLEEALRLLADLGLSEEEATVQLRSTGQQVEGFQADAPSDTFGPQESIGAAPRPEVVGSAPPLGEDVASGVDPFRTLDPRTAFRGFATGQFTPNLSGSVRQSALNQFAPTQLSFDLGAPETSFQDTDRSEGFARFLQGGGRALSPSNLAQSLVDTAGQAQRGELGASKSEFFSNNERLFESVLASALPRVNPRFRRSFENAARNQFSQQELAGSENSFLQTLGSQGGRLLGRGR